MRQLFRTNTQTQTASTAIVLWALLCHAPIHAQSTQEPKPDPVTTQDHYAEARANVNQGDLDAALSLLQHAFRAGLEDSMKLIQDPSLQPLIDHPDFRARFREIISQNATNSQATLVHAKEPGNRITVTGQLVDNRTLAPIPNVAVELVHTDTNGHYFTEKSAWNPRIFGYVVTDENGEFSITTIQPGHYRDDSGELNYAHIHFSTNPGGYSAYNSEFTFEDDALLLKNGNPDNVPVAELKNTTGTKAYHVTIQLQRNRADSRVN